VVVAEFDFDELAISDAASAITPRRSSGTLFYPLLRFSSKFSRTVQRLDVFEAQTNYNFPILLLPLCVCGWNAVV